MTKLEQAQAQYAALGAAYQKYRENVIQNVTKDKEDKFQEVVAAIGNLTKDEIDTVTNVVTSHK